MSHISLINHVSQKLYNNGEEIQIIISQMKHLIFHQTKDLVSTLEDMPAILENIK